MPVTSSSLTARPRVLPLARLMWTQLELSDRLRLGAASAAMLLASLGEAAVPVVIGGLVDHVVAQPGELAGRSTWVGLGLVAALSLAVQLLQVARHQLVETVATGYERDTRTRALTHILHLGGQYYADRQSGAVYMRTTRGIEGATRLLKLSFTDFLPTAALALAAVGIALSRNVLVGLVTLAVIPTGLALVRLQIRSQHGVRTTIRDAKESIDGMVIELLPAVETVRAYHAEPYFAGQVDVGATQLRAAEMRHHRAMGAFDAAKYLNEAIWFVLVLGVAVQLVRHGVLGPGEILTVALLFTKVLTPLRQLHRVLDESAESAKHAADLFALFQEGIDPGYLAPAAALMLEGAEVDGSAPQVALRLTDVMFAYQDQTAGQGLPALRGVSLDVRVGERVALVGRSGCGKSTLLRTVDRLQHGYLGEISLFGVPLEHFTHEDLAHRVGYVDQQPFVFRGSVRDNIVFGHPGPVSAEDIEFAARQAHLHEVIAALPQGYETIVQERGTSLSGGQRQRLCLARALLRRPDLLLLDEPTAALDNESERIVQRAINAITGVTIIEVAHRLSTVRDADRIVVLDEGLIVQEGSFPQLAAEPGPFRDLLERESPG